MELQPRGEPRGSRLSFRTMASSRLCRLCLGCSLLFLLAAGQEPLGPRAADSKSQEEKDLIEALQEVLEKLKTERLPSIEKKLGSVASCDAGEPCAVRKGARIGRLCSCPRGTACNFYILKCL